MCIVLYFEIDENFFVERKKKKDPLNIELRKRSRG